MSVESAQASEAFFTRLDEIGAEWSSSADQLSEQLTTDQTTGLDTIMLNVDTAVVSAQLARGWDAIAEQKAELIREKAQARADSAREEIANAREMIDCSSFANDLFGVTIGYNRLAAAEQKLYEASRMLASAEANPNR